MSKRSHHSLIAYELVMLFTMLLMPLVSHADSYIPSITRNYPSSYSSSLSIGTSVNFSIEVTDSGGNLTAVDWYVNGVFKKRNLISGYYAATTWANTFNSTGTYNVGAVAVDSSNNTRELSWSISITNSSPNVTRDIPSGSSASVIEGGAITFSMKVTDSDNNLSGIEWFVGSSSVKYSSTSGGSRSSSYTYSAGSPGSKTIYAYAYDNAGASDFVYWNLNIYANTAPSATRNSYTNGAVTLEQGQPLTLSAKGTDPEGNLNYIEWYVTSPNGNTTFERKSNENGSSGTDSFTQTYDQTGSYTVYAYVYDDFLKQDFVYWNITVNPPPTYNAGISAIGYDNLDQYFGSNLKPFAVVKNLDSTGSFKVTVSVSEIVNNIPGSPLASTTCTTPELNYSETYKCLLDFTPNKGGDYLVSAMVTDLSNNPFPGDINNPWTDSYQHNVVGAFLSGSDIKAAYLQPITTYQTEVNIDLLDYLSLSGINRVYINTGGICDSDAIQDCLNQSQLCDQNVGICVTNADATSREWSYSLFSDTRLWFNFGSTNVNKVLTQAFGGQLSGNFGADIAVIESVLNPLLDAWRDSVIGLPNKIHLNVEHDGSELDELLSYYIANYFVSRGWAVGISVLYDWNDGSYNLGLLSAIGGVDEISFQAYNRQERYKDLNNLAQDVATISSAINNPSQQFIVTFPYYAGDYITDPCIYQNSPPSCLHPLEEDIVRYQEFVKSYMLKSSTRGVSIYAIGSSAGGLLSGCNEVLPMGQGSDGGNEPYYPTPSQYADVCAKAKAEMQAFDSLFPGRIGSSLPHTLSITAGPTAASINLSSAGGTGLSVSANDSLGHSVGYSWSALCSGLSGNGSFTNASAQNPSWTAPSNATGSTQSCALSVVASDGQGKADTGSVTINVASIPHTLSITAGPTAASINLSSAGGTGLSVSANDSLGHSVGYSWSALCSGLSGNGSFTNASAQNPSWTAPSNATGSTQSCALSVVASDGQGLTSEALLDVYIISIVMGVDNDGDGIPNNIELSVGLNPNDPNDSVLDLDGDGVSNIDEYLNGGDLAVDDVSPVLTVPSNLVVDSTGPTTPVDIGIASAIDYKDGSIVPTVSDEGPYAPGRHVLMWSATDTSNNQVTGEQILDVIPMVNFDVPQSVYEGESVIINITLNGSPVEYPVTVPYTVSGTSESPSDHNAVNGSIVIQSGLSGELIFSTVLDNIWEGDESIEFSMGAPLNAIAGPANVHMVTIKEVNILPSASILIEQNGVPVTTIATNSGQVLMTLQVYDPNPDDVHVYNWSETNNNLVSINGYASITFGFDPAGLAEGVYNIKSIVTDDGDPILSGVATALIKVVNDAGIPVVTDSDGDRIPDSLDSNIEPHLMAASSSGSVMQTEVGYKILLGKTAFENNLSYAQLTVDMLDSSSSAVLDGFELLLGIFDFEISGIMPGVAAKVVIPMNTPIPVNSKYIKYLSGIGWKDFVTSNGDTVKSSVGSPGSCPSPGDLSYGSGLTAGHYCVELTITDGGPNDADGVADGVVTDPGGVASPTIDSPLDPSFPPTPNSVNTGSTGGGSISPVFAWLLMAYFVVIRKYLTNRQL